MGKSFLFLAEGFEEVEALTVVDVMRRAGMDVATVSVTPDKVVKGAHSIPVTADATVDEIDTTDAEWLIVPGGMPGATNVAACGKVNDMLKQQNEKEGYIAAICAAPAVVLAPLGILRGLEATCYPSFEPGLEKGGATYVADERVVLSGNVVTSNGPSSALPFALAIVAVSLGTDVSESVASGMLF